MDRKAAIHKHLEEAAIEILEFTKERESLFVERWVPAAEIKKALALDFVAVPKQGKQYGEKGWLFAILARMLEDKLLIEYKKHGGRAYYRSKHA